MSIIVFMELLAEPLDCNGGSLGESHCGMVNGAQVVHLELN